MESRSIHTITSSILNLSLEDPFTTHYDETSPNSKLQTPQKCPAKISKRKNRLDSQKTCSRAKRPKVLLKTHFNFMKIVPSCEEKKTQWSWESSDIVA